MENNVAFEVELHAFGDGGVIRKVYVPIEEFGAAGPDDISKLELIYRYGQNDLQPQPIRSVSVDDVIRYFDTRYVVNPVGFAEAK